LAGGTEVFFAGVAFVEPAFAAAALPTVKYLRILSSRFLPMPLIESKSSTLLNAPYDFRICKIFSAVAGPIPGTSCNCSELAVFILIGASGGFFVASMFVAKDIHIEMARESQASGGTLRRNIAALYCL